jgi:putative SOS response-associated peptidase YedK
VLARAPAGGARERPRGDTLPDMCGRYSLQTKRVDLARELALAEDEVLDLPPRWNVAPSQPVPILRAGVERGGAPPRLRMVLHVWGLVPAWAKDPRVGNRLINARKESIATRPSFRDAFHEGRRCLVLADGFYEWAPLAPGGPRVPRYIRMRTGAPFTFAGLWDRWRTPSGEPLDTCTIVTGPPNELVRPIHDRMPIILPAESREAWLDPAPRNEAELLALLEAFPSDLLETYPVSRRVNSPDHDDPECIVPLSDVEADALRARPGRSASRGARRRPEEPDLFGRS